MNDTDYIQILTMDDLVRYLWNEQGRHLASMLTVPSWDGADPNWIYISDDQLDYIASATELFALMTEFLHFDRDLNELISLLIADITKIPGRDKYDASYYTEVAKAEYAITQLAGDGISGAFSIFPCTNY